VRVVTAPKTKDNIMPTNNNRNLHDAKTKAFLVRLHGVDKRFFVALAIGANDAREKAISMAKNEGLLRNDPSINPLADSIVPCKSAPPLNARPVLTFTEMLQNL
jgi:hypothetical protein